MVIEDRELIGDGSGSEFSIPNIPLGIFFENKIQNNIADYGDTTWLTDTSTGKSMSYTQMLNGMRSVASALRKKGLRTGDNVVIIGCNFVEIPLLSLGIWRAGGSQACLAVNLPLDVIEMRLRENGTKFVLTDEIRANRMVEVASRLDFLQEIFVVGEKVVPGCTPFEDLLQDSGDECPENLNDVDLDSMAWLAYTSGTTGIPKGIVLTQRNVVGSLCRWNLAAKRFKYLLVNPMNNTAGLSLTMGLSLGHMDVYCLSNFSEENLLASIDRYQPMGLSLFPAHIAWLCRYQDLQKYNTSSVKSITVMGSQLSTIYEREIFDKLPSLIALNNIYGMSEVGLVCRTPPVAFHEQVGLKRNELISGRTLGSVGRVGAHCRLKVIDAVSREKLGPNEIGEICVKTPVMLKEYLNKPQETADFLRDGWAHTGDKGYYDENENVFVIGRFKELIKYRNIHVVPTNVEKHIMTHRAVKDVAVVGLPDEVDGERPLAFVVLSPDSQHVTADELITFTNERVMDEEKLRGGLHFVDKIPRNDLGKIVRPELMKLLQ